MKPLAYLGLIVLTIFGIKTYFDYRRDQDLFDLTTRLAEQYTCDNPENSEARLECQKAILSRKTLHQFPTDYSIHFDGSTEKLGVEDKEYYLKIKRHKFMSFGSCLSSFYMFDFDSNYVYLSKDNKSGIIFCKKDGAVLLIYPTDLSKETLEREVRYLLGPDL